ncbi:hypothetical protein [Rhodococcus opacus]|uniref:hypothetical protein n=1 Tax=Rhodococcus opacus TaxID=37919 RepID=UPI001305113C|nr:hypothetical protein [Rhodococcus opacus]
MALNIDGTKYHPADPMGKMFIGFLAMPSSNQTSNLKLARNKRAGASPQPELAEDELPE